MSILMIEMHIEKRPLRKNSHQNQMDEELFFTSQDRRSAHVAHQVIETLLSFVTSIQHTALR
ncbi:MAG: hypothetical protein ABJO09_18625 [Hyphomicrobiales bacterium]